MSRRRGRPPLDPTDPSTRVCIAIPGRRYDALYARASDARLTVPELIRRELSRTISNTKSVDRDPRR